MREVTLEEGLRLVQEENMRLRSDGLESNEYIHYELGKGLCYEDGALIGASWHIALLVLNGLEWVKTCKFWVEEDITENK